MASLHSDSICSICRLGKDSTDERLISLRSDGKNTLERFSTLHGDHGLSEFLATGPAIVMVHKSCQLKLTCSKHDVLKTSLEDNEYTGKNCEQQVTI